MPPGLVRSAAARSSSSWSSGSGCARQRRSGRRASTPRPEHGASTSARSKPLSSSSRTSALTTRTFVAPRRLRSPRARGRGRGAPRPRSPRRAASSPCRPARRTRRGSRSPSLRADDERRELRAAALRPDAAVASARVDALDAVGAGHVGRLADRLGGADDELARLVLRAHQRERLVAPEVAHPDLVDPVGVRVLRAARRAARRRAPRKPSASRRATAFVNADRALEAAPRGRARPRRRRPRAPARRSRRARTPPMPQRRQHGRVELAHRPPAELRRCRGRSSARAAPSRTRSAARARGRAGRARRPRPRARGRRRRRPRRRAARPRTRRAAPARSPSDAAQELVVAHPPLALGLHLARARTRRPRAARARSSRGGRGASSRRRCAARARGRAATRRAGRRGRARGRRARSSRRRSTPSSGCGVNDGARQHAGRAAAPRPRPTRAKTRPRRRRAPIGNASCAAIGPASSASTVSWIVTPVSSSPARIARSTGAAPRQRGSSDGWTLSQSARSSSDGGMQQAVGADDDRVDGLGRQLRPLRLVHRDAEPLARPPSPAAARACGRGRAARRGA